MRSKLKDEEDGADDLNASVISSHGGDGVDGMSLVQASGSGFLVRGPGTPTGALPGSPSRIKRGASSEIESPSAKKSKFREDGASSSVSGGSGVPNLLQTKLSFLPDSMISSHHSAHHGSRSNSPIHRSRMEHDLHGPSHTQSEAASMRSSTGTIPSSAAARWGAREAPTTIAKPQLSSEEIQKHIDATVEKAIADKTLKYTKMEETWSQQVTQLKEQIEILNRELVAKDQAAIAKDQSRSQMLDLASAEMLVLLRDAERHRRATIREKLARDSMRVGYSSYGRSGEEFREGITAKVLRERDTAIEEKRAAYEATKKRLLKRKNTLVSSSSSNTQSHNANNASLSSTQGSIFSGIDQPISPGTNGEGGVSTFSGALSHFGRNFVNSSSTIFHGHHQQIALTPEKELEDIIMQEQLIKQKLAALKVEEQEVARERDVLRVETQLHYKEFRRFQEEEMSKFNNFPVLHERYLMLKLLGRGGFSEVYRAYDLKAFRHVACKIHQLASNWQPEKKSSYLRHALREADIHKALMHPRIVALYDIFEIDDNTFCTVMEYCDGGDLDSYLKQHKQLPEGEARVLIAQLFDGLRYLMRQEKDKSKIIHYDLKPGNLLFDENGSLKIADFGLSKIMDSDEDSMELTSQGAGTYWYLPPECFDADKPKISSKVDVWSAGVILYQMLFGCKPFGHNISQKHILERNLIHSNVKVEFPASKKVSDEAKNFLLRCLTANVAQRPDALELASDPFLSFLPPQKKSSSASSVSSPSSSSTMGPPSSTTSVRIGSMANNSPLSTTTTIGGGTFTLVRK